MNTTANRIKKLRKKAGLNQSQLAQQTGISEQSISKYECGERNPKIENLEALANFFKVPVSYLRGRAAVNRLKKLRQENNLTLRQLGKKLNMRDNTLSQYETGKRHPKLETWQKLADYFNVSVDYLQGIDDEDYIEFACNECGYTFKVPRELKTKVVSCPFCSCQETSYEV